MSVEETVVSGSSSCVGRGSRKPVELSSLMLPWRVGRPHVVSESQEGGPPGMVSAIMNASIKQPVERMCNAGQAPPQAAIVDGEAKLVNVGLVCVEFAAIVAAT